MRAPIVALTPDVPDEMLLTPRDVAEILGCEKTKANELLGTAKIPGAIRIGIQYRIPAGKVRAFIAAESLPKNPNVFALERASSRRRVS
jgi:excisionase family DNA binding protein